MTILSQSELHQAIDSAPSLPVAAVKAINHLSQGEVDYEYLCNTISYDPVLATRVLSVANSSFYGMEGRVKSLADAFMILGSHAIRNIVLAAAVVNSFPANMGVNLDYYKLWQLSVGTAVAAKLFAKLTSHDQESALLTGLLSNIGRMFLDSRFSDKYKEVILFRNSKDCLLHEAENSVLGIMNNTAGAILIKNWHLPDEIPTALMHLYQPNDSEPNSITDLVHLSNIITRGLNIGSNDTSQIPKLNPLVLSRLDLDISKIAQQFERIEKETHTSMTLIS